MTQESNSNWMKKIGGKSKDSENSSPKWLIPIGVIGLVFFIAFASRTQELIAIPIIALLMSPFWIWMRNRHELNKQKLKAITPEETSKSTRIEERIANLEALLCRVDTELNQQMERSLISNRMFATPTIGQSAMPTTLLSMASALEGRYQVLSELGRGGMGIVYQAYDKQLKEQVAIKLLSPLLSTDTQALERLTREVSLARRVTHPNVIRIHDIAEVNGLHYVSMEYFGGTNLKEHLKRSGPLSLLNAYQILSQMCSGLEAAHSQGVVHRDLKSQNVMVGSTGQIKIIDFGLARSVHLEGMTATGLIMGTPEYMAPEQVAGKHVDERADIYALGVILFEMLTGRVPFTGDSPIAVGFQQLKDPPPSPRSINPQIPEEVEQIILKALEKNPIHRYRNVDELRKDFEAAMPRFAAAANASQIPRERPVTHEKN